MDRPGGGAEAIVRSALAVGGLEKRSSHGVIAPGSDDGGIDDYPRRSGTDHFDHLAGRAQSDRLGLLRYDGSGYHNSQSPTRSFHLRSSLAADPRAVDLAAGSVMTNTCPARSEHGMDRGRSVRRLWLQTRDAFLSVAHALREAEDGALRSHAGSVRCREAGG